MSVQISNADFERLKQYKGQRMLLLPNHPTGEEPLVLFEIASRMGELLHFVAAREVFEWERGLRGWLLTRGGAYSILRGMVDRSSLFTSRQILMEGKRRLVIFIEGEISRETDSLIPFEPGVIQLAFWAQESLARAHQQETSNFPSVFVAPIAIQYEYLPGHEHKINKALEKLEAAVGLPTNHQQYDRFQRLQAIGLEILRSQEAIHQLPPDSRLSTEARIQRLKNRILEKIELFLGLNRDESESQICRMRKVRNTMDALTHAYEEGVNQLSAYEKRIIKELKISFTEFYQDLDRLVYLQIYDEHYLKDPNKPARFFEVLRRLEREVHGVTFFRYPRIAKAALGEIIDLKPLLPEYEKARKVVAQNLTTQIEENMWALIQS